MDRTFSDVIAALKDNNQDLARRNARLLNPQIDHLDLLYREVFEPLDDKREDFRDQENDDVSASTLGVIYPPFATEFLKIHRDGNRGMSDGWMNQPEVYAAAVRDTDHLITTVRKEVRDIIKAYTYSPWVNRDLRDMYDESENLLKAHLIADAEWEGATLLYAIRGMDYAIDQCKPLEDNLVTYRGIKIQNIDEFSVHFQQYTSVSANLYVAKQFSKSQNRQCCVVKILLPKGCKVLAVRNVSHFPEQEELILPRNGIFKLTGTAETIGLTTVFVVEYIPPSSLKYDYETLLHRVQKLAGHWGKGVIELLAWDAISYTKWDDGMVDTRLRRSQRIRNRLRGY